MQNENKYTCREKLVFFFIFLFNFSLFRQLISLSKFKQSICQFAVTFAYYDETRPESLIYLGHPLASI